MIRGPNPPGGIRVYIFSITRTNIQIPRSSLLSSVYQAIDLSDKSGDKKNSYLKRINFTRNNVFPSYIPNIKTFKPCKQS